MIGTHHFHPSAYALRATVLILVEHKRGDWVPVHQLARDVAQPFDRVFDTCMGLVQANHVQHGRAADGQHYVGIGSEGRPLPSTEPTPAITSA